jgi:hypothetical protein
MQTDIEKMLSLLQNIQPQKPPEPTRMQISEMDGNVCFVKEMIDKQEAFECNLLKRHEVLSLQKQKLQQQLDSSQVLQIDNLGCRQDLAALNREIYIYEKYMQQEMERYRGENPMIQKTWLIRCGSCSLLFIKLARYDIKNID